MRQIIEPLPEYLLTSDNWEQYLTNSTCRRNISTDFERLVGQIFTEVYHDDETIFFKSPTAEYILYHEQDCDEDVYIEDICGDLADLCNEPILYAKESINYQEGPLPGVYPESYTWTYYRIRTNTGTVIIRFYGTSNGYYSETASFYECVRYSYDVDDARKRRAEYEAKKKVEASVIN